MTKLEEIQEAISQLGSDDLAKLRDWFDELEEQLFDEQIENDERAGKLEHLAERAGENYRAGRFRDL